MVSSTGDSLSHSSSADTIEIDISSANGATTLTLDSQQKQREKQQVFFINFHFYLCHEIHSKCKEEMCNNNVTSHVLQWPFINCFLYFEA